MAAGSLATTTTTTTAAAADSRAVPTSNRRLVVLLSLPTALLPASPRHCPPSLAPHSWLRASHKHTHARTHAQVGRGETGMSAPLLQLALPTGPLYTTLVRLARRRLVAGCGGNWLNVSTSAVSKWWKPARFFLAEFTSGVIVFSWNYPLYSLVWINPVDFKNEQTWIKFGNSPWEKRKIFFSLVFLLSLSLSLIDFLIRTLIINSLK